VAVAALALVLVPEAAGADSLFPRKERLQAVASVARAQARFVPDELLVTYRRGAGERRAALAAAVGGREVTWNARLRAQQLQVAPARLRAAAARLRRSPAVAHVERNRLAEPEHVSCVANPQCALPNDPGFPRQWWLQNDAATVQPSAGGVFGADIAAPLAWLVASGSAEVNVAVVDTGIDRGHPDVGPRVVRSATLGDNAGNLTDYVGHGTAVAGIIAAVPDNGIGVAGAAWNASLINVKVQNDGSDAGVSCSSAANGITYATDAGAHIINLSFSSVVPCSVERSAIDYAAERGVLVIAAAGNHGTPVPHYPAAFANAVSVAATDSADRRAEFSSYGAAWVDLAAPGVRMWTTLPMAGSEMGAGYGYVDGTSFAAPVVAGIAAMIWRTVPDADGDGRRNDDVAARLAHTADAIAGTRTAFYYGRVNACLAAAAGAQRCPPPVPQAAPPVATPAPAPVPAATPAPAAVPAMSVAAGRRYVRRALADLLSAQYRGRHAASERCRRSPPAGVRCTVAWSTTRWTFWGTATVRYGRQSGRLVWHRNIVVRRAGRVCASRHGRSRCPVRRFLARR